MYKEVHRDLFRLRDRRASFDEVDWHGSEPALRGGYGHRSGSGRAGLRANDIGGFIKALDSRGERGTVTLPKGTVLVPRTNGDFTRRNERGSWLFFEIAL